MTVDANQLGTIAIVLALLGAGIGLGIAASRTDIGGRVGRLAASVFIVGIALAVVSLFLAGRSAGDKLDAERAGKCLEALAKGTDPAHPETVNVMATVTCTKLIDGNEKPTADDLLAYQTKQTMHSARSSKGADFFGTAATALIAIAIADGFAKRLMERWKSEADSPPAGNDAPQVVTKSKRRNTER